MRSASRRTLGRFELAASHPSFGSVSPGVGQLDASALEGVFKTDPDEAVQLLSDLTTATDPELRRKARELAARVFVRMSPVGVSVGRGTRILVPESGRDDGDLDLERTLERTEGTFPRAREDIVVRRWRARQRALCLLVDHSGSMRGRGLAMAAVAAASLVTAAGERADCSVIAFSSDAVVLKEQGKPRSALAVVNDILDLRGKGTTNLSLALRAGAAQLRTAEAVESLVLLLSDCMPTAGGDPSACLRGIGRMHVLGTSAEPDSIRAGSELARKAGGRYARVDTLSMLSQVLPTLLT